MEVIKRLVFICFIIIVLIQGCTLKDNSADEIEKMKSEIEYLNEYVEKLETEIKDKDDQIERMKEEDEIFHILSNLSLAFVRGHTQGNIEKIKSVVSNNIDIIKENYKIYGVFNVNNQEVKYILYDYKSKIEYQDMVIQGYGYYDKNDTYVINIREFYNDECGNAVSPPTFLNLYFKEFQDGWKIVEFEFDV